MSDSRANANLAKPQAFETKNLPHGYAPAPTPEIHQQTTDPGYSNTPGPEGDGGGEEWAVSDAAAGKFSNPVELTESEETKKSPSGGTEGARATTDSGGSTDTDPGDATQAATPGEPKAPEETKKSTSGARTSKVSGSAK